MKNILSQIAKYVAMLMVIVSCVYYTVKTALPSGQLTITPSTVKTIDSLVKDATYKLDSLKKIKKDTISLK